MDEFLFNIKDRRILITLCIVSILVCMFFSISNILALIDLTHKLSMFVKLPMFIVIFYIQWISIIFIALIFMKTVWKKFSNITILLLLPIFIIQILIHMPTPLKFFQFSILFWIIVNFFEMIWFMCILVIAAYKKIEDL